MQDKLEQARLTKIIHWPTPQEYNEALQTPELSFGDPLLRSGVPEMTALGLPRPITGTFASVYRMRCADGDWAVRCFLHDFPNQRQRYALLHESLAKLRLSFTVGFQFQEEGVRCDNRWYPILKMTWCEGETLNRWIERHLDRPDCLSELSQRWLMMMKELRRHGIAHGDLQHGNVLVLDGKLKLVDYDGMYVPELSSFSSNELGHRNYQHPGRTEEHFGPWLDNFSAWLIYLSLKCLSKDPSLWHQLSGGEECLLLRRSDLENPQQSPSFYLLEQHSCAEIRECSRQLRYLLTLPVQDVPEAGSPLLLPELIPPVSLPEPLLLPDWVEHYEPCDVEDMATAADCRPAPTDYIPSRRRRRTRSRVKSGARSSYFLRSSIGSLSNSAASFSADLDPAGRVDPAAASPQPVSGAMPAGSTRVNVRLLSGGLSTNSWSKLGFGALILVLCAGVAALQIVSNDPSLQRSLGISTGEPALQFPALSFDAKGEANLIALGRAKYDEGALDHASMYFMEALDRLNERLYGEQVVDGQMEKTLHRNLALAYQSLGDTFYSSESLDEAASDYEQASQEWENATGDANAREIAVAIARLALTQFAQGNVESCIENFDRAMRIFERYPKLWDEERRQCLLDYASVLRYKGDTIAAEKIEKKVPQSGKRQGPNERLKHKTGNKDRS